MLRTPLKPAASAISLTTLSRSALKSVLLDWGVAATPQFAAVALPLLRKAVSSGVARAILSLVPVTGLVGAGGVAAPLIADYENGDLKLDHYITHRFEGVEGTLEAVKALHSGDCLRAVVTY